MSPELIAYQNDKKVTVDHRSDLFQLGLILWFMLTGAIPRGGLDVEDDPSGGLFLEIVAKATKQRPERRFDSVSDMLDAVRKIEINTKPAHPTKT